MNADTVDDWCNSKSEQNKFHDDDAPHLKPLLWNLFFKNKNKK